ncbi:hypothetical protein J3R83DRAFT_2703 [Lanmaoa asiatica]|nr:hypothetical protein J3R83DRAFT_2703 [Lanmaoa asiatica]
MLQSCCVCLRVSSLSGHPHDRLTINSWAVVEQCWSPIPERPLAKEVVTSLQQLLDAHPPPLSLRNLLDVPAQPSSVPHHPRNADLHDDVTPIESPLGETWPRAPTGTSALASPPAPKDITRRPDPSTNQIQGPPPNERKDIENKSIAKGFGEDVRIHGLVASGLPTYLNEEQAQEFFQNVGELKRFHLVREDGNGPSKGIAFFEYVDASVTDLTVQCLNGMELRGRYIVVQREGTASDADKTHRPPMTERKVMGNAKDKKPTRVDKGESQKQPERASAGYYCTSTRGYSHSNLDPESKEQPRHGRAGSSSGPSTIPKPKLRADTVSQNKPTTSKSPPHPPPDDPLPLSKWVRGTFLGAGTYGRVYLALNSSSGEMIAVKQVKKDDKDAQRLSFVPKLKMEREILSRLDHPHIIGYLGSEETATSLNILLEYVPGGTLASFLRKHGRFDEEVIKSFTAQIFDGLAYLHANHIIHRNIEVNNILVELSGICKISGFGNAQRADDDRASWTPMRGIVPWTAPEALRNRSGKRYRTQSRYLERGLCVAQDVDEGKTFFGWGLVHVDGRDSYYRSANFVSDGEHERRHERGVEEEDELLPGDFGGRGIGLAGGYSRPSSRPPAPASESEPKPTSEPASEPAPMPMPAPISDPAPDDADPLLGAGDDPYAAYDPGMAGCAVEQSTCHIPGVPWMGQEPPSPDHARAHSPGHGHVTSQISRGYERDEEEYEFETPCSASQESPSEGPDPGTPSSGANGHLHTKPPIGTRIVGRVERLAGKVFRDPEIEARGKRHIAISD